MKNYNIKNIKKNTIILIIVKKISDNIIMGILVFPFNN